MIVEDLQGNPVVMMELTLEHRGDWWMKAAVMTLYIDGQPMGFEDVYLPVFTDWWPEDA